MEEQISLKEHLEQLTSLRDKHIEEKIEIHLKYLAQAIDVARTTANSNTNRYSATYSIIISTITLLILIGHWLVTK